MKIVEEACRNFRRNLRRNFRGMFRGMFRGNFRGTFHELVGILGYCQDLWELPVGDFENIAAPDFPVVSEEVYNSFSNDVKYLYRVCLAAISINYSTTWHGLAI